MADKLQPVRGTHDILPDEFEKFHAVVTRARELAALYGFREMATPIFEATEVFKRSMGDTSDVVSKEMFNFATKGGEDVCLRPEFTAGIARAFISNGMQQHLPLKLFSTGPLFRYERPQKGRQRQFHQVNFEWLGDDSAEADVEIILLAGQLLTELAGKQSCKLLLNTLGDTESRTQYRQALIDYLTPFAHELSADSQRRLISNPLRILDSKDTSDRKLLEAAPIISDYLSNKAKKRFDAVCNSLMKQEIAFFQVEVAPSLVRGLDYYTDIVFEFIANTGELGAQNTVLAGGRYDGLIEQMGGKPTPAIGFAAGLERLILLMKAPDDSSWEKTKDIHIVVLPFEDASIHSSAVQLITTRIRLALREILEIKSTKQQGIVEILWDGKLSKRLDKAAHRGATHALIISPEELARSMCILRNMETREQQEVHILDIVNIGNIEKFAQLLNISLPRRLKQS
ncbi:MAG: histidine--tRNA ligase [Alphaproteobacteria bacterium]|nr:histidine--tRNA ligase [Alphaproteobacteria bacterium]